MEWKVKLILSNGKELLGKVSGFKGVDGVDKEIYQSFHGASHHMIPSFDHYGEYISYKISDISAVIITPLKDNGIDIEDWDDTK